MTTSVTPRTFEFQAEVQRLDRLISSYRNTQRIVPNFVSKHLQPNSREELRVEKLQQLETLLNAGQVGFAGEGGVPPLTFQDFQALREALKKGENGTSPFINNVMERMGRVIQKYLLERSFLTDDKAQLVKIAGETFAELETEFRIHQTKLTPMVEEERPPDAHLRTRITEASSLSKALSALIGKIQRLLTLFDLSASFHPTDDELAGAKALGQALMRRIRIDLLKIIGPNGGIVQKLTARANQIFPNDNSDGSEENGGGI